MDGCIVVRGSRGIKQFMIDFMVMYVCYCYSVRGNGVPSLVSSLP